MTERTLLLRCANAGNYFIVGTDFPSARVFDTNTSSLATVVELPPRSRTSLSALSLTSVAMGLIASSSNSSRTKAKRGAQAATQASQCIAAVGLSDGTVLVHDVTKDVLLAHVAVSETQHALTSLALCGQYLFALTANHMLYVVDVLNAGLGPVLKTRAQQDASAIAAVTASETTDSGAPSVFRVLVAGPTHVVYNVQLQSNTADEKATHIAEKLVSFASQGSNVDYAWLSSSTTEAAAVTASAQEGAIRIWDLRPTTANASAEDRASLTARCRRTLLCGQRIANLCVLDSANNKSVVVLATTFTGAVLLWDLGDRLLPRVVEPAPLQPTVALFCTTPAGRLLYATLLSASAADSGNSTTPLSSVSLMLLRGRFALPRFEAVNVGTLARGQQEAPVSQAAAEQRRRAVSSLGFGIHPTLTVIDVPSLSGDSDSAAGDQLDHADAASTAFTTMDNAWVSHQQRIAAKSSATPTESFKVAHAYHAATLKELPVKQLTLEQRLRKVTAEATQAVRLKQSMEQYRAPEDQEEEPSQQTAHALPSLGLATVPLYQALHANDVSAVMELLSIAARSSDGIRATVLALQLPYALQLLGVLSERLGIVSGKTATGVTESTSTVVGGGLAAVSCRTPLLEWVDALMHYRGMEMYAAQLRHRDVTDAALQKDKLDNEKAESETASVASPPKDFVAPILHQYRSMCSQYDKLASLHGRLSIFNAVRPNEKGAFVNRARKMLSSNMEMARTPAALSGKIQSSATVGDDIIFPTMFKELRTKAGPHVVRVRSRLDIEKKKRQAKTTDSALLREAKRLAKESAGKKDGGLLDGSDDDADMEQMAAEGEMDLETMEAMGLGDEDDADGLLSSSDGEEGLDGDDGSEAEDDEDDNARRHKKNRHESAMIAESGSDDDGDAELDSDAAEFSAGSDDELRSDILDDGSDEESSDEDEEDEDDEGHAEDAAGHDEDDDSSDDGMGEDMQDLLDAQDTDDNDKAERRKSKRVRTD